MFFGSVIFLYGLGFLVYKRKPGELVHQVFLGFTTAVVLALIFNYLSDALIANAVTWNRLTFSFGAILVTALTYLALLFPNRKDPIKIYTHFLIIAPVVILVLSSIFTDLVVKDITVESWGTDVVPGALFDIFTPVVLVYSITSLVILWRKFLNARGRERQQILYVLLGLLFFLISGTYTQLISFFILGDYRLAKYGPYAAYFLSIFTAYAIVAHRLFDIRVIIKRTVVFTGVSAFVLGLYSSIVFIISGVFGSASSFSGENLLPSIIGALAVAFGFNPVYKWLTEVTDKWLFKGEYKQEDVLHELADTLANVIDLEEAIRGMMQVVVREMRLEKAAVFMLHAAHTDNSAKNNENYELKGVVKVGDFNPKDLRLSPKDSLMQYFEDRGISNAEAVLTEELDRVIEGINDSGRRKIASGLIKRLEAMQVAVAMPLIIKRQEAVLTKPGEPAKTKDVDTFIGVLLLGAKKSGDTYSDQDLKLLQIVSAETAAAVEKSRFFEEDRLKTEFVSIASHELLTPTTAMKGFLSMVLEEGIGEIDDKAREQLEKVYSESKRLARLVKDLLNVSRIERNKIIVEIKEANIVELAKQAVDSLEFKAKEDKLKLELVEPKGKIPSVSTDPEKAVEIMINLLGNSLKYTKKGGVKVEIKPDKDRVFVNVIDTGIGISAKDQSHLFTKFFRASNVDETQASGTGLGLYVSKHVSELMGGTISVQSELGKGSIFTFVLPIYKGKK